MSVPGDEQSRRADHVPEDLLLLLRSHIRTVLHSNHPFTLLKRLCAAASGGADSSRRHPCAVTHRARGRPQKTTPLRKGRNAPKDGERSGELPPPIDSGLHGVIHPAEEEKKEETPPPTPPAPPAPELDLLNFDEPEEASVSVRMPSLKRPPPFSCVAFYCDPVASGAQTDCRLFDRVLV